MRNGEPHYIMHTDRSAALTRRPRCGITGLATAVVLIAFVVVAAVFAFTVLSVGIFYPERSKETVYSGDLRKRATAA